MRSTVLFVTLLLAGCASDPARIADGPRNIGTVAARPAGATWPHVVLPHVVLENMMATARQITIFGKAPVNADVDHDLRTRAAELDAEAVINVRYGKQGVGMVSRSQISGEGQAIRYTVR